MKTIVYIGDFSVSYSTELYIAKALESLGYNVLKFQENNFLIQDAKRSVDELKLLNPVLVMFSKGCPAGDAKGFIEELKKNKIPTCLWLFDLYFGLPVDRMRLLAKKFPPYNVETIFSTDGGHDKEWKELGINHKTLRQGIHEPEAIYFDWDKRKEIIFVGGDAFGNRKKLLTWLREQKGSNFEWYGQRHNKVRGIELNKIYGSSCIVVGDSQPSPNYWSNRVYETLGRGGFLLHPRVEGIESEFEDGKHLVLYERDNLHELDFLIRYYLDHPAEREAIRRAGFEHCKANYTYQHRCKELMKHYE